MTSGPAGGGEPAGQADEARFQALFDVSPLATVQYGPDGTVELWNPAAERLFGWSAEEARGRRLPEGAAGEEARVAELGAALRRGEALRQVAAVLAHRDGTPRPVELSSAPLHDEDDRLVGVLVVHTEPAPPGVAFAALVQHSSDVVVVYGPDQRCAYVSPSAERVLGWRPAELVGTALAFPIPTEDQERVLAAVAATAPGHTARLTHRFLRPDGTRVWVETVMTDLRADPAVAGLTWHVREVTEQVQAIQALRADQERYRSVVQQVGQAVFEIDGEGRWSFLNEGWHHLTGLDPVASLGAPVLDLIHPDDRRVVAEVLDHVVQGASDSFAHQARLLTDSGEPWVELRGRAVLDATGGFVRLAGIMTDITARKQEEARLADLALQDPLTSLANRTLLLDRLEHALARSDRSGRALGVLFVDLDRFKEVNDSYGHEVGDHLLVAVGQRLRHALRASETIGRYGGDEFVVVSEGLADAAAADAVAQRVRAALAEPFAVQDRTHQVGASVGVAVAWPGSNEGAAAMIKQADLAMYRVKGRRFE